jgi:hypothetical protein
VEFVAFDQGVDHFGVADSDPGRVGAVVEFGVDFYTGSGGGAADEIADDLMAGQRSTDPVHRDMGEEPVLDLVLLARARW